MFSKGINYQKDLSRQAIYGFSFSASLCSPEVSKQHLKPHWLLSSQGRGCSINLKHSLFASFPLANHAHLSWFRIAVLMLSWWTIQICTTVAAEPLAITSIEAGETHSLALILAASQSCVTRRVQSSLPYLSLFFGQKSRSYNGKNMLPVTPGALGASTVLRIWHISR